MKKNLHSKQINKRNKKVFISKSKTATLFFLTINSKSFEERKNGIEIIQKKSQTINARESTTTHTHTNG